MSGMKEGFAPDADKSFSRQKVQPSADKEFPMHCSLEVVLYFSIEDMEKVKKWYETTRKELGDKFLADLPVKRLIFEALTGGAVNPSILSIDVTELEAKPNA